MQETRFARRSLALATALALALVVAACGGNGDDAAPQDAQADTATVEREIQAGLDELRRGFEAGEGAAICAGLTRRGRAETASTVQTAEDCPSAVATLLEAYGDELHSELTVVRLRVDGDRAVATLRSETGNTYPARFARLGDSWRMDQSLIPSSR
jgi:hypothetical protein